MIVVVDYGVNNLASVVRALAAGGHEATLAADPEVVRRASRVVMPGVGHFARAAQNLAASGLGDAVREVARSGRPVMGICLGMQLFFPTSEEAPGAAGLGLLEGTVRRFRTELPVPHVGWARVEPTAAGRAHGALAPVFPEGGSEFFYHVHSYHPDELPDGSALAFADYGERFATIVGRGNVLGAQFHPEKSQRAGIGLLSAFAGWTP
ncbi:MAG TPA: imidazole glycerol phosphate synthase subunit HisH [Gemmatimonadales bacterium]|nr:imidazole glycerol phosphate synthase subunit HisH [Gemmatimonadales bacterium]